MNAPAVTLRRWTREEYERMVEFGILTENDRVELVGGEIVEVAPQKGQHAYAVGLAQDVLVQVIGEDFHLRVQMPLALGADSEPEPDIAVIAGSRHAFPTSHPTSAVLVIEVSETTLAYDRRDKGSLYARAGIPEYWIENLTRRVLEVSRDPAPDARAPFGYAYRERRTYGPDERVELLAIPGAVVQVRDLLP